MAAAGWFLLRPKQTGAAVQRPSPPAWDATHEKAFLAEQLRRNPKHTPILLRLAQMERADGDLAGARRQRAEPLSRTRPPRVRKAYS